MSASLAIHAALSSDQLLTPAMIAEAQRVIAHNKAHRVGFQYAGKMPSSKSRFDTAPVSGTEFKPLTKVEGVNHVAE